jgi:hypothetical protein
MEVYQGLKDLEIKSLKQQCAFTLFALHSEKNCSNENEQICSKEVQNKKIANVSFVCPDKPRPEQIISI